MKMGSLSLFSSAQFGHKTRRKTHSVAHSEHTRKRFPPSPSGRSTASCGLDPQKGQRGGDDSVDELVRSARYSAKGWSTTLAKNVYSAGISRLSTSCCQNTASNSSRSSGETSANAAAACLSDGEPDSLIKLSNAGKWHTSAATSCS